MKRIRLGRVGAAATPGALSRPGIGRGPLGAALLTLALLGGAPRAGAGDNSLPLKTLNEIKAATVFLKVVTPAESVSGTGFVIRVDGGTAYVVTNHHVVDPSLILGRGRGRPAASPPTITAVFGSGTAGEQSLRAEVLASDARHDLAVLRVGGVANPPRPLDLGQEPNLVETMPVFIFGFPLGELLATGKRHPAITVGRGSVSSIRLDDQGRLATVQVNGDLTPGNSGGPVVDAQGRLVGVAVATVRNRQIGFTIPAAQLKKLLQGHLTDYHFTTRSAGAGAVEIAVELGLFDPFGRVRAADFYYLRQDNPGVKKLAPVPGAQRVPLRRDGRQLVGRFTLDLAGAADAPVTFQAVYHNGEGKTFVSHARVRRFRASGPPVVAQVPVPPPPLIQPPARVPPPAVQPGLPLGAEALTLALADLRSNDNNRRRAAADRLYAAKPGDRRAEVVQALLPLVSDRDLFVRTAGVKAYIKWAGRDGLPKLHEIVAKCDCFITRAIVLEALPKLEGAAAAGLIASRLPDLVNRSAASKALQEIGPAAESAVLPYLGHQDWGVRVEACKILKTIGTANSLAALKKAAQDTNAAVARAAQEALQEAGRRQPAGQRPGAPAANLGTPRQRGPEVRLSAGPAPGRRPPRRADEQPSAIENPVRPA